MSSEITVWPAYIKGFKAYLQLERSMSANTIEAYLHDVLMLGEFIYATYPGLSINSIELAHLQSFLVHINELDLTANTQARVLSGIKSFFRYLLLEDQLSTDPTQLLEAPKLKRVLPVHLSIEEIEAGIHWTFSVSFGSVSRRGSSPRHAAHAKYALH